MTREAFDNCSTAEDRAACDVDLFLEHYFLTDGQPDPRKTTQPLILDKRRYPVTSVDARLRKIPGLHQVMGGWYPRYYTCVGWDVESVEVLADIMRNWVRSEELDKQNKMWQRAYEEHRAYMTDLAPAFELLPLSRFQAVNTAFDLRRTIGSYVIKCVPVTENWPRDHLFTLDIGTAAGDFIICAFNFGLIRGDMLLCCSNERLDHIVGPGVEGEEADRNGDETQDEAGEADRNGDETQDEAGEADRNGDETQDEAGEADNGSHAQGSKLFPTDPPAAAATSRAKRDKLDPSVHRVYYRMNGYESDQGAIVGIRAGHLDFSRDGKMTFNGLAYSFPYLAGDIEFRGFRVADAPRKLPETVANLSWLL